MKRASFLAALGMNMTDRWADEVNREIGAGGDKGEVIFFMRQEDDREK